jgi:hypothetical protein
MPADFCAGFDAIGQFFRVRRFLVDAPAVAIDDQSGIASACRARTRLIFTRPV